MCGWFGSVFASEAKAVEARLEHVLEALAPRGPDDAQRAQLGAAWFAFARLAVQDLSTAARQPMRSRCGQLLLVFNGEIYNFRALRAELSALGHRFDGHGDSEVLLAAYAQYGAAVTSKLRGMYAFAVFDARRQRLFAARDLAGKKPLFYAQDPRLGLCLGSEPKALFAAGVVKTPRLEMLGTLLQLGHTTAPDTMYEGVFELPPGCSLFAEQDAGGALQLRIVHDRPSPLLVARENLSDRAAIEQVRSALRDAVSARLLADVPLGCFLSGGIDSSLIAEAAQRQLGGGLQTFAVGFDGDARYDESAHARTVAEHLGTTHRELRLGDAQLAAEYPELLARLVRAHDAPFADSSAIPTSLLAQFAREHVTVALSGDGGDELFCGYWRLLAGEAAYHVPGWLGRGAQGLLGGWHASPDPRSVAGRLLKASALLEPDPARRWLQLNSLRFTREWIRPELRERVGWARPLEHTRELLHAARGLPPLPQLMHHNYSCYLPFDLLVKADRCSMMHGLEVRSPLLDTELTQLAARLPLRVLRRGTVTKWVLRELSRGLPERIRTRPKMGFGVPLGRWYRGALRTHLRDQLGPAAKLRQWIDPASLDAALSAHERGERDHAAQLFLLSTLECWLQG